MLRISASTVRDRWQLFAGALLTVTLGVALVQSAVLVLVSTGEPKIPPGTSARDAEQIREGYAGAATLLGMATPLAMFLAMFIVGSTFAFAVEQRRRELALLRMLGGSRPQLIRLLLGEAFLLGLIGSVLGIVLGVPAAWVQARLLIGIGLLPDGFSPGWSNSVLLLSPSVGITVAVCGVLAASYRSAKVRPLDALRNTPRAARVMTAGRWLVGLSSLALTLLLIAAGNGTDLLLTLMVAMGVSITGSIALSALSPLAVPLVGGLLGTVLRTGVLGELAQANLRDAVRRSASTAAPVIVLVGLLVGLTGTLNSLARATGADLERITVAELVVTSNGAAANRIPHIPGVALASPQSQVEMAVTARYREDQRTYRQTHHSGIIAVDGTAYRRTHRLTPTSGSLDELRGRTIAIGPGLAGEGIVRGSVTARIGDDRLKLRTVARLPEVLENRSANFLVPRDLVPAAILAEAPTETMVQVVPGTSPQAVAGRIRAAGIGDVRTTAQWADARVKDEQRGTMGIMAVLMGMSGLYAAIAVINAVVIAAAERRTEFAVARATGLSRGQVVRMATIESTAVTVIGLFLGSLVAVAALAGFQQGGILAVPWTLLALLIVASLAVTAGAGALTTLAMTKPSPTALVTARE
ncbi:putative ABC transport system permease protein [Actinomadura pelletieri DSM 43383]|uniref:Putative ABC transport system permease protein n=1 Tax=Actinomadura pelletieri DSM 43383 TaxID=1120940 RepID=A0A495QXF3_9ACTN|nr:ABC transporter permease [Actinomadura pelletieri]RKS78812.1 putative ABC transport system permease protein [Actinomadura pelletieri DSM 43383]